MQSTEIPKEMYILPENSQQTIIIIKLNYYNHSFIA